MSRIDNNLGPDYHWPGNIRELEQCVRNVMIHNRFSPQPKATADKTPQQKLLRKLEMLEFTSYYATLAYAQEGSFAAAANRLDIGWRTLKSYIDEELLESFRRDRETG